MSEPRKYARGLLWTALAVPGLSQLGLLVYTMLARAGYPYDLEWMEGGLLAHAYRIARGLGIYVEPTIHFIPYLYTPLYPGLLAVLGGADGPSYALGRAISILSVLGIVAIAAIAIRRDADPRDRAAALCGGAVAAGLFAATYPWVDAWYDLVRADTLFVFMAVGGVYAVRVWARAGAGWRGHARIAAAGALLALSFFCKQTGVLYVAAGGLLLFAVNWRRVPIYVAVTGTLGLGGTWLFNRQTGGWFWTYVYEVHQTHDFNMDRFYQSFGNILLKFPAMTGAIVAGLVAVAVAAAKTRRPPRSSAGLLVWSYVFAVSVVVGAVGWGTQWAHFNAYIPAMVTGAIAAGAALPALAGAASALAGADSVWRRAAEIAVPAAVAAGLGIQLVLAWWSPAQFIPTQRDREAGRALVDTIREFDGDVFVPYHPWYAHLADKPVYVHRMGLLDMSFGTDWRTRGVREALVNRRFDAVILDNRPPGSEFPGLRRGYRVDDFLPRGKAPRVYSGANVVPRSIWIPPTPPDVPPEAEVLWDFEGGRFDGWRADGAAWGPRPRSRPVHDQGPVRRYGGRYFVTSMHGGDGSTGALVSPPFRIEGNRLTFRLAGGDQPDTLRAELVVGGRAVKTATGNGSEGLDEVSWSIAAHDGDTARIRLVDRATGAWGHLNADEFWIWDE